MPLGGQSLEMRKEKRLVAVHITMNADVLAQL